MPIVDVYCLIIGNKRQILVFGGNKPLGCVHTICWCEKDIEIFNSIPN